MSRLAACTVDEAGLSALTASLGPVPVDELAASVPDWAGESMFGFGGVNPGLMAGL